MKQQLIDEILEWAISFRNAVPDAARIQYDDLLNTTEASPGEEGLSAAIRNFFGKYSAGEFRRAELLDLGRVVKATAQLGTQLSVREKILFAVLLFKLLQLKGADGVRQQPAGLTAVVDALRIHPGDTEMLRRLFSWKGDEALVEHGGLWITGECPDFNKMVDGLQVHYLPGVPVHMWCVKLTGCDLVLTRIFRNQTDHKNYFVRENDVLPMNTQLSNFLRLIKVNPDKIAEDLSATWSGIPYIYIPPTESTPTVILDPHTRRIDIYGHSVGVNPRLYYDPVLRWIDRLKELSPGVVELHVFLNYFNTYSSKVILEIFFRIRKYESFDWNVVLFWHYQSDDDDLRETGENYADIVRGDFRMVEHDNASRLKQMTT